MKNIGIIWKKKTFGTKQTFEQIIIFCPTISINEYSIKKMYRRPKRKRKTFMLHESERQTNCHKIPIVKRSDTGNQMTQVTYYLLQKYSIQHVMCMKDYSLFLKKQSSKQNFNLFYQLLFYQIVVKVQIDKLSLCYSIILLLTYCLSLPLQNVSGI